MAPPEIRFVSLTEVQQQRLAVMSPFRDKSWSRFAESV